MNEKTFAKLVKTKRKKLGLTQSAFAKHIGKSWITVWRWENMKNPPKSDAIEFWVRKIKGL